MAIKWMSLLLAGLLGVWALAGCSRPQPELIPLERPATGSSAASVDESMPQPEPELDDSLKVLSALSLEDWSALEKVSADAADTLVDTYITRLADRQGVDITELAFQTEPEKTWCLVNQEESGDIVVVDVYSLSVTSAEPGSTRIPFSATRILLSVETSVSLETKSASGQPLSRVRETGLDDLLALLYNKYGHRYAFYERVG